MSQFEVKSKIGVKSLEKSIKYREEGNRLFQVKHHHNDGRSVNVAVVDDARGRGIVEFFGIKCVINIFGRHWTAKKERMRKRLRLEVGKFNITGNYDKNDEFLSQCKIYISNLWWLNTKLVIKSLNRSITCPEIIPLRRPKIDFSR